MAFRICDISHHFEAVEHLRRLATSFVTGMAVLALTGLATQASEFRIRTLNGVGLASELDAAVSTLEEQGFEIAPGPDGRPYYEGFPGEDMEPPDVVRNYTLVRDDTTIGIAFVRDQGLRENPFRIAMIARTKRYAEGYSAPVAKDILAEFHLRAGVLQPGCHRRRQEWVLENFDLDHHWNQINKGQIPEEDCTLTGELRSGPVEYGKYQISLSIGLTTTGKKERVRQATIQLMDVAATQVFFSLIDFGTPSRPWLLGDF